MMLFHKHTAVGENNHKLMVNESSPMNYKYYKKMICEQRSRYQRVVLKMQRGCKPWFTDIASES
jgi:hypothetical protein